MFKLISKENNFMITELEQGLRNLFDQPQICASCIGHGFCCRRSACNCHPLDFDRDLSKMREALATGKYAIDFTRTTADAFIDKEEGYLTLDPEHILKTEQEALYIRPRNINRPIVDIIHLDEDGDEGPCVLWTYEKGCELPYEERPFFGRTTIANKYPELCCSYYDLIEKRGMVKKLVSDWKPYTFGLFKLAQEYFDANWKYYRVFGIKLNY